MGNCLVCSPLCQTCQLGQCLACVAGSNYDGRKCVRCGRSQFFDTALKVCRDCPSNCETCPDGQCSKCKAQFVLASTPNICLDQSLCRHGVGLTANVVTCRTCPANCFVCSSESVCQSCKRGHFLRDGQCHACMDNCLFCFHDKHCLQCIQDFWFDRFLGDCIGLTAGTSQTNSPFQYISLISVSTASAGAVVFADQSMVFRRRDPNCVSFDLTGMCMQCRAKYFLGLDNECHLCPGLCLICNGIDRCTVCQSTAETTILENGFVECTRKVQSERVVVTTEAVARVCLWSAVESQL